MSGSCERSVALLKAGFLLQHAFHCQSTVVCRLFSREPSPSAFDGMLNPSNRDSVDPVVGSLTWKPPDL